MKIKLKCITVTFRFCSSRKGLCSWRQRFQFLAFRRFHKKLQLKLINMTIINSVWSLTLICYLWGTGLLKFVLARTTTKYLITKTNLNLCRTFLLLRTWCQRAWGWRKLSLPSCAWPKIMKIINQYFKSWRVSVCLCWQNSNSEKH